MTTKAVIYARYSSHNQREESIEGQLRECHELQNTVTVPSLAKPITDQNFSA